MNELTPRQMEVMRLICAGYSDKQAADELSLSRHTIDLHVRFAIARLGAFNRANAVHLFTLRFLVDCEKPGKALDS